MNDDKGTKESTSPASSTYLPGSPGMMDGNKDIVKSNALIEAIYHPGSINQMRLLMVAMLDIKADERIDNKKVYTIHANDTINLFGRTRQSNYEALNRAANELAKKVITVLSRPNGAEGPVDKEYINIVSSAKYIAQEGCVKLRFTEEIIPYLSGLKSHFTVFQAKYIAPMRSGFSIRLYELCLQWICMHEEANEIIREFEIHELKRMLGVENKYKALQSFKVRVINPALKEINAFTNLEVEFGYRKKGRAVTHIQFLIRRKGEATPKKISAAKKVEHKPDEMSPLQKAAARQSMIGFCNRIERYEGKAKADEQRRKYGIAVTDDPAPPQAEATPEDGE